jgi:hypothetical protein
MPQLLERVKPHSRAVFNTPFGEIEVSYSKYIGLEQRKSKRGRWNAATQPQEQRA